jgi:CrcB protein
LYNAGVSQVIAIAAGGALGALLRHWVGGGVQSVLGPGFPWGTLLVNVSGCVAIGVLYVFLVERPEAAVWRAGLIVGLLGAYTTFSAFSLDTLQLLEAGAVLKAALNVLSSVVLCLAGCWAGLALARWA